MKTYEVIYRTMAHVGILFTSHSYECSDKVKFKTMAIPSVTANGDLLFTGVGGVLERAYKAGHWLSFQEVD